MQALISHRNGEPVDQLKPVLTVAELKELQDQARNVRIDPSINGYMLDLVAATRKHEELMLGVSTRGAITLFRAVQSLAFAEGRDYAVPDDVKRLAGPVLAHRVQPAGMIREGQRKRAQAIIQQLLNTVPPPT
jgi:MoxR-like ATPase